VPTDSQFAANAVEAYKTWDPPIGYHSVASQFDKFTSDMYVVFHY
jgi:hypothetical protein